MATKQTESGEIDSHTPPVERNYPETKEGAEVKSHEFLGNHTTHQDPILTRVGVQNAIVIVGCFVIQIAAMGFIGFLWYGDINNSTWHEIVARNWVARAVTLTSLAIRVAVAVQGALCLSMLAAITLEAISVPVADMAGISLMRSGNKTDLLSVVLGFIVPMMRRGPEKGFRGIMLTLVIAILSTTLLTQFASTALLGDVVQQMVPGLNKSSDITYDFRFSHTEKYVEDPVIPKWSVWSGDNKTWYGYDYPELPMLSLWQTKTPLAWPTFAEYSEPPYKAAGVVDTGVNLRAFMPFALAQERQSIRNYTGKALVLDSRVTCQQPKVTNLKWENGGTNAVDNTLGIFGTLTGVVETTKKTPKLNDKTRFKQAFGCYMYVSNFKGEVQWSICQIVPMPLDVTSFPRPLGDWYMPALESTFRKQGQNQAGSPFVLVAGSSINDAGVPLGKDSPYVKVPVKDGSSRVSDSFTLTMCHASYDVASRFIEAYSNTNRSEPTAIWDNSKKELNIDKVINQLDSGYSTAKSASTPPSLEDRGVLHLKNRKDWTDSSQKQVMIDGPDQLPYVDGAHRQGVPDFLTIDPTTEHDDGQRQLQPYITNAINIKGGMPRTQMMSLDFDQDHDNLTEADSSALSENPFPVTWTAVLASNITLAVDGSMGGSENTTGTPQAVTTQEWVVKMFNRLKENPAVALQALITSMAGIAYYDAFPQYDKTNSASQVFFTPQLSPGGPWGARRTDIPKGFIAVVIVLAVHFILVLMILIRFITFTNFSRISDGWQAVAQLSLSKECKPIMEAASGPGGDKTAKEVIKNDGLKKVLVKVEKSGRTVSFRKV